MEQLPSISKTKYLKVIFYFLFSLILFQSLYKSLCLSLEITPIYSLLLTCFSHQYFAFMLFFLNCSIYRERCTKGTTQCIFFQISSIKIKKQNLTNTLELPQCSLPVTDPTKVTISFCLYY